MQLTSNIQDRTAFITFLITTIICVTYYILYVPVTLDDSYIYFRVVERFIATGIPTFNDGDTSNITTSPLWLIILTIASIVTCEISLITLAKTCSIIIMLGAAWLLYRILDKRLSIAAPLAGIAIFFTHHINTLIGHDTPISLMCALGIINAFESDKKSLPIWVALFYLARGEGAVFGGIVALIAILREPFVKRIQYYFFPALIGAILIIIWHSFNLSIFGDIFPATFAIKRLQAEAGWITFTAYTWKHLSWIGTDSVSIIAIFFSLIGMILMFWKIPSLIFWPIIHFAIYALLHVPNYHWYYYPIDFILGLAIIVGISYTLNYIIHYAMNYEILKSINSIKKISIIMLSIVLLTGIHPILKLAINLIIHSNTLKHLYGIRYPEYVELAAIMPRIAGRLNFTLLTHEVGIFGYLNPRAYIRDVVGLATPVHNKNSLWKWNERVAQFNPDLILWPSKNTPLYQHFGLKPQLKLFERVIVSKSKRYALYRRVNSAAMHRMNNP